MRECLHATAEPSRGSTPDIIVGVASLVVGSLPPIVGLELPLYAADTGLPPDRVVELGLQIER